MNTDTLINCLDNEFDIKNNKENLLDYAISEDTEKFVYPEFSARQTGLMLKGNHEINKVYSVVFITDIVLNKICQEKNCLIFTHHHFNYFEDERGLQALSKKQIQQILASNNSLYVAHAPLDTHPVYGTSIALAKLCNIQIEKFFFDYFGAPAAVIGNIETTGFSVFSDIVREKLKRPILTLKNYNDVVHKIAVVAGGGDMPEILQEVYDNGCDTLLTGTVEHLWNIPFIQEANKKFHKLNEELKINLIGGTHYGTERPAMINIKGLFDNIGIDFDFCEDEHLLNIV